MKTLQQQIAWIEKQIRISKMMEEPDVEWLEEIRLSLLVLSVMPKNRTPKRSVASKARS